MESAARSSATIPATYLSTLQPKLRLEIYKFINSDSLNLSVYIDQKINKTVLDLTKVEEIREKNQLIEDLCKMVLKTYKPDKRRYKDLGDDMGIPPNDDPDNLAGKKAAENLRELTSKDFLKNAASLVQIKNEKVDLLCRIFDILSTLPRQLNSEVTSFLLSSRQKGVPYQILADALNCATIADKEEEAEYIGQQMFQKNIPASLVRKLANIVPQSARDIYYKELTSLYIKNRQPEQAMKFIPQINDLEEIRTLTRLVAANLKENPDSNETVKSIISYYQSQPQSVKVNAILQELTK